MKNRFFLWFFLLFAYTKTIAQNNLPPAYEIESDTGSNRDLDNAHWQMLEDSSGKLTIEDVSKPPLANKFHTYDSSKGIDYSINTYWFRCILKNSMNHDAKISLTNYAAYVDYYTPDSIGKWNHQTTGILVPWSKRDGFKSILNIPFTIKPDEQLVIYQHVNYNYIYSRPTVFYIGLSFTDKLINDNYINNDSTYSLEILSAIAFGILILGGLFNLFFYRVVKEKEYLFFSLFLLFLAFQLFEYQIPNFLFREYPVVGFNFYVLSVWGFFFFTLHFIRYYLKTFQYYPRWDKFLFLLSFIMIADFIGFGYILPFTSLSAKHYEQVNLILVSFCDLYMFFILITLLLFIRKKDKLIRIKIISALPIFLFWGLFSLYLQVNSILNEFYNVQNLPLINWLNNSYVAGVTFLAWLVVLSSWILFQRYQKLRKDLANEALDKERLAKEKETERALLIEHQKVELEKTVEERTAELKQSLHELKSTQAQLIQSEKMASLGELTAGIAHEIQNPLNFVNNFSEVNKELIEELQTELKDGKVEEAVAISNDIKDNSEKINHHGKRADAIVKNMLQHSKQTRGLKEPTDINALCDEYLRLSYHGLRAKDKSFNAEMKTDFDETIGKINVIAQDIGRVLLNLFNNAFYAVNEKKKTADENYKPCVSVQTEKLNEKIEIKVADNGNGIPEKIIHKIFQPFFTTKPTGEGTGLGLSLSYDIIKAHGGEIKVETKEGQGSEFIIQLPPTKT